MSRRSAPAAARAKAVEAGFGERIVKLVQHSVVTTFARPEEERAAATRFVSGMEAFADEWDEENGPLWLGWALHQAFLSGVDWARKQGDG